jgi:hypothetical protein
MVLYCPVLLNFILIDLAVHGKVTICREPRTAAELHKYIVRVDVYFSSNRTFKAGSKTAQKEFFSEKESPKWHLAPTGAEAIGVSLCFGICGTQSGNSGGD